MREILLTSIELDSAAQDTYLALAGTCGDDEDLARTFRNLATEEEVHVRWWSDLFASWEAGRIPDITDGANLSERIRSIRADVLSAVPADLAALTVDEKIELAVRLEFFMLDPLFGRLAEMIPAGKIDTGGAYARHIDRVIALVERRYSSKSLASFLASALRRSLEDQRALVRQALRDPLTGVFNRRGLFDHLEQWLAWADDHAANLGVVLVDLDHFKSVNDLHGHLAGDQVLIAVAGAITAQVRSTDVVGRFGGDEFIVVTPDVQAEGLEDLMVRIAEEVRTTVVTHEHGVAHATVSVGGAISTPERRGTCRELVVGADRSLFHAKECGRDQTCGPYEIEELELSSD